MAETVTISPFSFATVPFSAKRGAVERTATAFLLRRNNDYFLVTALHVLTGRHWQTKRLSDSGLIPEQFTAKVPYYKFTPPRQHDLIWARYELKLIEPTAGEYDTAAPWLVHPKFREDVDVGVIPLTDFPKEVFAKLQSKEMAEKSSSPFAFDWDVETKLATEVGDDVFVVGFPENIKVTAELPIWKRGSVATEPDISINGLPYVLVDTGTRGGMSGAPVLRRMPVGVAPFGGPDRILALNRPYAELFGVYSGRYGADELTSQLGIVWKREVISDILNSPTLGKSSACTRLW